MEGKLKHCQIEITPGKPLNILERELEAGTETGISAEREALAKQIGDTMIVYFEEIRSLLDGKYSNLKEFIPSYLAHPKPKLFALCWDGLIIRFDRSLEDRKSMVGFFEDSISNVVAKLSNELIQLHTNEAFVPDNTKGIDLAFYSESPGSGVTQTLLNAKIRFDSVLKPPKDLPHPPRKPFCLCSIEDTIEFELHGFLVPEGIRNLKDLKEGDKESFVALTRVTLPVGWECIQIFPYFDLNSWNPAYAPLWAENDLLAIVTSHQIREKSLHTLDPHAEARKKFEVLFNEFEALLNTNPDREEVLQQFLRANPQLLNPSYIRLWPKLALGKHVTDFVFQEANGDYLLVELERSTHSLFRKDGDFTAELNHALGQITDWNRYIEDNLPTVQRELGLSNISSNPKGLVVMGRSNTISEENRRKLTTAENERPKRKILTYDDVLKNAKTVVENLLGPFWANSGTTRVFYPGRNK